jgi:hypothetical protein
MSYIRIVNDIAVDSVELDPSQCFTPDIAAEFTLVEETVIPGSILVNNVWVAPQPNEPITIYKPLSRLDFINHLLNNGLTSGQLVAAKSDANLQIFWIKLEFAAIIERSNNDLLNGLNALVNLNYLTEDQKQSILNTWP